MHPNPAFRQTPEEANIAFARETGFGLLCVGLPDAAPLVSHIPFLLSGDGALAEFHLVRSNPIARLLADGKRPVRLAVQGPHSYVSPDWYAADDQVPTWNYIAVHLEGIARLMPAEGLHDLLDRQSALFEEKLRPKPPWTTAKMTPEEMQRMMRQIVPCAMEITGVHGTWKLNQNKTDAMRLAAAPHVAEDGIGLNTAELAALMRQAGAAP